MHKSSLRWYYAGFIFIIFAVLAFELIWLPAPLVMRPHLEWIEVVDWLYYAVLVIPLCWFVGGFRYIRSIRNNSSKLSRLPALLIMIGSLGITVLLLQPLKYIIPVIALLVMVVLLIAVEIVRSKPRVIKLGSMIIGYAAVLLVLVCPTGYQVTYPAMTMNMSHYAQFAGLTSDNAVSADSQDITKTNIENTHQMVSGKSTVSEGSSGWIDGVLVFERPAFPIDWLYEKLLPQVELRKLEANAPSISETYSQVAQMKSDANKLAAAMAWEFGGKGEAIVFQGATIVAIVANSPADGVLQAGDVIFGINGQRITNVTSLQHYMNEQIKPSEQVEIELQRGEETMTVQLTTIAAEQDASRAIMGVVINDKYDIVLDQEVELASYLLHAGGPSHGAMLTLALLNQLVEEDITGGLHVAGTGTIEVDGSVGMVGGIPQKAYAVSRSNADVFFVPTAGVEAARLAAPELNIVGVEHFTDILTWLQQHGNQIGASVQ